MHVLARGKKRERERSGNRLVSHSHGSISLFAREYTSQSRRARNTQRRRTDRQIVKGDNKCRGMVRCERTSALASFAGKKGEVRREEKPIRRKYLR